MEKEKFGASMYKKEEEKFSTLNNEDLLQKTI